jgi:TPP-dependent indolepyruvate ferredoxin oxidoreductase alpha subunit
MNLLPDQNRVPGGVRMATTAGMSEEVALGVSAAAAAAPQAAATAAKAAIGTGGGRRTVPDESPAPFEAKDPGCR